MFCVTVGRTHSWEVASVCSGYEIDSWNWEVLEAAGDDRLTGVTELGNRMVESRERVEDAGELLCSVLRGEEQRTQTQLQGRE
jgi:hypothetical protein